MRGNSQGLGTVLIFIAAAIALGFLYQVSHLLPPIILGLLLGYVLYPFIRLFDKFRVPRGLGVLLIFTLFVSGITYSASILSPLVRGEMELLIGTQSTGQSESKIYEIIDNISEQLYHYRLISENLNAEQVIDQLRDFLRAQNRRFIDSAGGAAAQAGQFMMIFLGGFHVKCDSRRRHWWNHWNDYRYSGSRRAEGGDTNRDGRAETLPALLNCCRCVHPPFSF